MRELVVKGIATSFVYHKMKLISDKGSGEGKLFIGAVSKSAEFDSFFEFGSIYKYKLDKQNLLNYMHEVKLEYVYQFFNKYQEANIANWEAYLNIINSFETQDLIINLVKQADSSRYYIDQEKFNESDKLIFKNFIRKIIVPKLTNIVFEKNIETKEITLRLFVNYNFPKQEDIGRGILDAKEKSLNRIIFGAPGTGKSHKLDLESNCFTSQEQINEDVKTIIKNEVAYARELKNNKSIYNAIGFKYSEELNVRYNEIESTYGKNTYEIYVGAKAAKVVPQLEANKKKYEENEDNDYTENIKREIKAVTGEVEKTLDAIGFVYGDVISGLSLQEIYNTFDLDPKESKAYWLSRGAQASVVFSNEKEKTIKFLERVTFHPNYSYSQFVGTYKPMKSRLDQDDITYEYVPGPFMRVYVNAKKNPEKNFLLLIEEINRANVAAVFGDVFQLLDRKDDGISQYPIAASEDQKNYLESCGINEDEIAIPDNMYIWATMNSADQGVLPMDAAFKRRWDFEYLDIDENEDKVSGYDIPISLDGKKTVKWNELRKAINDKLTDLGINEDKLLGPFFMSDESLSKANNAPEKFVKLFESKVIMYLFEDVVKMKLSHFFNASKLRYSIICKEFEKNGLSVFKLGTEVTVNSPETESAEDPTEQA